MKIWSVLAERLAGLLTRLGLVFGHVELDIPEQRQPGAVMFFKGQIARRASAASCGALVGTHEILGIENPFDQIAMALGQPESLPGQLPGNVARGFRCCRGRLTTPRSREPRDVFPEGGGMQLTT